MKSNLVDALRRAQEEKADTTLSDSGSFDATQQQFTAPANQDSADAEFSEDAAEFELMSTTRDLAINDIADAPDVVARTNVTDRGADPMSAQFNETMASATVFLTGSDCVIPDSGSLPPMPRLARHVPALCLVLALVAGVGWQAYQRLELRQEASVLGAFGLPPLVAGESQEIAVADEAGVRFRYLSAPLTASEIEAAQ